MIPLQPALAALAVVAAPQRPAEAPLYGDFQSFCARTGAEPQAALAAADAAGWMPLAKSMVPVPPSASFTLSDYAVRLKSDPVGIRMLIAGTGSVASKAVSQPVPGDICLVLSKPAEPAALERARTWAGVEPFMTIPQQNATIYAFVETPEGHQSITQDPSQAEQMTRSGRVKLEMLMSSQASDATVLGYISMKKW